MVSISNSRVNTPAPNIQKNSNANGASGSSGSSGALGASGAGDVSGTSGTSGSGSSWLDDPYWKDYNPNQLTDHMSQQLQDDLDYLRKAAAFRNSQEFQDYQDAKKERARADEESMRALCNDDPNFDEINGRFMQAEEAVIIAAEALKGLDPGNNPRYPNANRWY